MPIHNSIQPTPISGQVPTHSVLCIVYCPLHTAYFGEARFSILTSQYSILNSQFSILNSHAKESFYDPPIPSHTTHCSDTRDTRPLHQFTQTTTTKTGARMHTTEIPLDRSRWGLPQLDRIFCFLVCERIGSSIHSHSLTLYISISLYIGKLAQHPRNK
jgi:hypothetical protein